MSENAYGSDLSSPFQTPSTHSSVCSIAVSSVAMILTATVPDTVPPFAGEVMLTVGAVVSLPAEMVKFALLVAVPFDVVTLIGPVVAVVGTVAVMVVEELTLYTDVAPLNFTAEAPVKLVPVSVTDVPLEPPVGVNETIVGDDDVVDTVKFVVLAAVPLGVVTLIGPVVAVAGTVALIEEADTNEKDALTPLNLTDVAPVRLLPLIVTDVPVGPLVGVKELTDGGD